MKALSYKVCRREVFRTFPRLNLAISLFPPIEWLRIRYGRSTFSTFVYQPRMQTKLPHGTIEIIDVITARVTWRRSVAHLNHQLYSCRHVRDVPGEARTKALDESEGASRRLFRRMSSPPLLHASRRNKIRRILLGTDCEEKFYLVVG